MTTSMTFADFKAMLDARFAAALPKCTKEMTTGELRAHTAEARAILKAECAAHGYNQAAISIRWQYGEFMRAF